MDFTKRCEECLKKLIKWNEQRSNNERDVLMEQVQSCNNIATLLEDTHTHLVHQGSIDQIMEELPQVGQILGRISMYPLLISNYDVYSNFLRCLLWFHVDQPKTELEEKTKQWSLLQLRRTVCNMDAHHSSHTLNVLGYKPADIHGEFINMVSKKLTSPWTLNYSDILKKIDMCRLCLHALHIPSMMAILESNLMLISNNQHTANTEVTAFFKELTQSQQCAYSKECSVNLSRKCFEILWQSHLPALEQEVLCMIDAVTQPQFTDSRVIKKLLLSRHLVDVCSEDAALLHATFSILSSFSSSSIAVHHLQCQFLYSIFHLQNANHEIPASVCSLFPSRHRSLVTHLQLLPQDLTLKVCQHQVSVIVKILHALRSTGHEAGDSVTETVMMFPDWKHAAIIMAITGKKEACDDCCHLALFYFISSSFQFSSQLFNEFRDFMLCLRGLLSKTMLSMQDIDCAVSTVSSVPENPPLHTLVHQALLVFTLISTSTTTHIFMHVLNIVNGCDEAAIHLQTLLDTVDMLLSTHARDIIKKRSSDIIDIITHVESSLKHETEPSTDDTAMDTEDSAPVPDNKNHMILGEYSSSVRCLLQGVM